AGSLRDFDLAARLSRAAADSGVGTEARVDLAYNLVLAQQGDEAASVIDSIAAEEVAEEAFINDVILRAANLLWAMRSPEESWRVIDEALEDATGPRRGQLLAFRANQLMLAARPADVVDMMSTADYGTLDGYGEAVRLCSEIFALAEVGRTDDALIRAEACHAVIASCEQGSFLSQALVEFHAFALTVAGRNHEALALVQRHQDDCGADPDNAKAMAAAIVGAAALSTGDLPTAVQELPNEDAAGDPHLVLVNSFYRFQLLRAQALARLGDVDAARTAIRIAEADWHPTYVLAELNTLIAKAWLAAVEQRLSDARELVRQATIFTREHGQLAREVVCLQTAVQFGDTTVAERLSELAGFVDGARAPLAARYARALDVDDANELDAVSADFEEMGDVLAAADAAGHASAAHRRAGRRGPAMTAGSRAEALASACGGATSPAIVMARFTVPFTRREHEIALLVARGLSNKEIAESVSLSVRTIEGHIYRASCKVGVTSRSDLAVAVRNLRDRTLAAAR
ncbi:MAG TPA: helix-turn-helix transcriptional regulator, partial [Mycobacterium sp.]|nr:helix-turn-helix transcriptional regulator [Mycobacterium sp.]